MAFIPDPGNSSLRLLATGTSARAALPTATERGPRKVRIIGELTPPTWVALGGSTVVAAIPATTPTAANGVYIHQGQALTLEIGEGVTHIAYITDGSGNNVIDVAVGTGNC